MNRIIESDNLIALEKLLPEYEEKIDVMPIDPPYNTAISYIGYKDSDYQNGWVEFMRPRLEIAYRLLSPTGVMFIHIDENEFFSLWNLCATIFGGENIMSMIWKKTNEHFDQNRKEKPLESGIRRTHEFIVAFILFRVCKKYAKGLLNELRRTSEWGYSRNMEKEKRES